LRGQAAEFADFLGSKFALCHRASCLGVKTITQEYCLP
jgi:hypothetical protein